jgi:unsaturated chondroitin disaccharide hydrolase
MRPSNGPRRVPIPIHPEVCRMPFRPLAGALLVLCVALSACAPAASRAGAGAPATPLDSLAPAALDFAADQYRHAALAYDPARGYPRSAAVGEAWRTVGIRDWTSGFFPGTLWYLAEYTGDAELREQAERWTWPLAQIPQGYYDHDLGFQFFTSFGNAFRITADPRFREPLLGAAGLLAERFDPAVGAIRSWSHGSWSYPVIIDNLMNLELLTWAARHGGDRAWAEIARHHAERTAEDHIRPDGGSFHVVDYAPATGAVVQRMTHQGYADSSTWARGQSWGVYGYVMMYRETADPRFLRTAREMTDYALARLPPDHVPCWDYQAPGCPESAERDASAAAILASALLELSTVSAGADGERYRLTAERILASLASPAYLARGTGTPSVLLHSVGHRPRDSEVDVALNYADYYFVEALLRYLELRDLRERAVLPRGPR